MEPGCRPAAGSQGSSPQPSDVTSFSQAEFRVLFADHRDGLFRFLYRLTGDAADAEDLLQDTFLAVWRKRGQFEGRGSALGYLRRTAFRLFLNARETRLRRPQSTPAEIDVAGPSDVSLERDEALRFLAERVSSALADLPDAAREVFVLFRYEGLSCPEIAELTAAPVKTVETRLRRATQLLSEKLRPYRDHLPVS